MRPSVVLPCFFGHEHIRDTIEKIAKVGYDCAELWFWTSYDLEALKQACKDYGVELCSICTTEFRMTSPECHELWLDALKQTCRVANTLGASFIISQVGYDTGAPRDLQRAAILEKLEAAKPILEAHGICLLLEALNQKVDSPTYFMSSSQDAFGIIREVNHPLIRLVYDIYHQQITEGHIIDTVTQNLNCIAHLHAAGNPGRHELWLGENDYQFIFDAIDRTGYTGACGLEYYPTLEALESLAETRKRYF